jgi:2-polyprenyl-3-methyl-5-hydroxy-6-metoxy-1,4-benzoquinol methylase
MIAASAAGEGSAMSSTDQVRDAFVERVFASALGTMDVFTVYLGDRLGLYRMLAEHGPLTAGELAERAGMYARYAREWLEQQAATAILEVDDAAKPEQERRFSLPAGRAEALIDPESPYAMAAVCRSLAALGGVLPKLVDAYRTGEGVAAEGADAVEAQGDFNRPWLVGSFATEYLPQVPDVHEKLEAGARVADIACGVGWAAISIARGYPATTVDGFDLDEPAIALARANALDAGVADRVTFQARDAADPSLSGQYDLAVIVEAVHDMSRPVDVLASVRRLLAPGGTLIVADERVADAFHAPASETERLFYGYSVLDCLPTGMVSKPSAETGTVMRRSTLERYAATAEFSAVSVLPIEHDFLRFYRLDP